MSDLTGDTRPDESLLTAVPREPDAFAVFYRRHARELLGFFMRRTGNPEMAADLTAETFAQALASVSTFDARRGSGAGWLFGIARHELAAVAERGAVEDRARRRMGMTRLALDDEEYERIDTLASLEHSSVALEAALDRLPRAQRRAITEHLVEDRSYADIAERSGNSTLAIRQRVSRGLAALRTYLKESL